MNNDNSSNDNGNSDGNDSYSAAMLPSAVNDQTTRKDTACCSKIKCAARLTWQTDKQEARQRQIGR